jgi:hypothetical protein
MPYLPLKHVEDTNFPVGYGKDLLLQIRMIEEKYNRHYPTLKYHSLRKAVTPRVDLNTPIGEPTTTQFDPLYNEAVPVNTVQWQQPHLSGSLVAPNPELFDPPVEIHARVQREAKEKELKKYGFDEFRDLLVFAPASMFDNYGMSVQQGDKLEWDDDPYTVLQYELTGYWKNTNLRLYVVMNCQHYRAGS